jgi:two-component system, NtrC family, nitrogen regulation response regulator GlnG
MFGRTVDKTVLAMSATILVADDDRAIRTVLNQALARLGHDVRMTGNASTLWRWIADGEGDLVITDVIMPDENGLDLIPRIKKLRPDLRVIVMSAQNTLLTAVKATERGAFEYLPKPFDLRELISVVERALSAPLIAPSDEEAEDEQLPLIGRSPAMQEIYRSIARLMGTDLSVLITGESGTGTELVARALHDFGKRRSGPFVAINMAAIPRELIESELFGHERGAFTGAAQRSAGRFEQAKGGTLFLDEIGDMPFEAQTRLLRVLQEGEYTSVGGRAPIRADSRIIAATHRDLSHLIRQGVFREDLFYRLNVAPIRIPPLRERTADIPALVRHFASHAAKEGLPGKVLDEAAMERLRRYRWPGNVRELENLVRRLAALYSQEVIGVDVIESELAAAPAEAPVSGETLNGEGLSAAVERHINEYFVAHKGAMPAAGLYDRILREIERPLIVATLVATRGNQIKAAYVLGLNRNTLRKKIRELDIPVVRGLK